MKEEILEAKRKLYSLLLKVNNDILTDNEVGLMMSLSKDEQIQSLFKNKMEKEQPSTIFLIEKGLLTQLKINIIMYIPFLVINRPNKRQRTFVNYMDIGQKMIIGQLSI